ncbi:TorD/DmsD family molecular chaperone [Piscinibacter koreensis]|nr:molecular chaperone TorD family protein [Schlegelella koreensis]
MTAPGTAAAARHEFDADAADERARADLYGLLAALFHEPPAPALLASLQAATTDAALDGAFLASGWRTLVEAARRVDGDAIADEYAALFLGLGKPEVFLYGSFHIAGTLNQKPLVDLRDDLRRLGLERPEHVEVTEDHVASLCEVMRVLIGDGTGAADLAAQQRFFDAHLRGWVDRLFEAIVEHPRADFYRAVAAFAKDFFAVEAQAFDLLAAGS